jgi:hypothetical protein
MRLTSSFTPLTVEAVATLFHACGFTPGSFLNRTWVKTGFREGRPTWWRVAFVQQGQATDVGITCWEGATPPLRKLGTYQLPTEVAFVDLLADLGWLR